MVNYICLNNESSKQSTENTLKMKQPSAKYIAFHATELITCKIDPPNWARG